MKRKREDSFVDYFKAIKETDLSDATEYTLRTPLHNLLDAFAKDKKPPPKIISEPKRDKTKLGAPDFKVKFKEAIVGYMETKKVGENLDAVLKSDQIAKYKKLSGNIILTNYLEWIWLKDDSIAKRETLCYISDVGYHRARLDKDKADKVAELIAGFLSTPPQKLADSKKLAYALAVRCHVLRDFLFEELKRQTREGQEGRLHGLYAAFQKDVFHQLELIEFADAFAQTLGYGLFLAKLQAGESIPITLQNAKKYVPANFELIRELVNFLDELEQDEYRKVKWLVEEILSIFDTLDLTAIHENLAFVPRQGRLYPPTEEERLLFAKDPYVYFYEDFLKAYDKATSKARGVYYTPRPVVNFIVRAINDLLKDTFSINKGLAAHKHVTVLDFAAGTGTFLLEILHQIFESVSEGIRHKIVKDHVLKNLYGFEYLIAPYTVAHLKLSQFLHDKDLPMQPGERLNIYLTNTLEPIEPLVNRLLPALSREVATAQEIKEKPILVIIGNPPYNVKSRNTGEWITNLLKNDYFKVDGKKLEEKNPKNLLDDYVKFIRFAQWKMEQVEEGIVGIITNHSFLDNPTFRGMRQSLMKTFNQIYVLDLHGNKKKKERAPDGGNDENVFDIEQGVAISLLVKKNDAMRKVFRADLWGHRKGKYAAVLEAEIANIPWQELQPDSPFYLFVPQNKELREQYNKGWKISDIFKIQSTGVKTHRDHFVTDFEETPLRKRIEAFCDLSIPNEEIAKKYALKSNRDWDLPERRKSIAADKGYKSAFTKLLYRPFDIIAYFHHDDIVDWPRREVMHHMIANQNIGLVTVRQVTAGQFNHAICSSVPVEMKTCSHDRGTNLFPLYLYPSHKDLLEEDDAFKGKERIENFESKFRVFVDKKYKHCYSPEEILGYLYAVLHSPTYREKYLEFLKRDFPCIPFVNNSKTFETLSTLGWELVQAHLYGPATQKLKVDISTGNFKVEKPTYNAQNQRLNINKTQYFTPVPQDVWDFHIGGYQVLNQYLKARKGRTLSLDEIENIQNILNVLRFTIDQMQRIDKCWKP
ncbi:MAG: N-6 DNA methylase [Nitrospira sp.]|nr:N-6 DNA methylase [Nitrospira sp.]MDE0503472.1 N-6 DNA methylase [Candidatus Poribacteria bacterium]